MGGGSATFGRPHHQSLPPLNGDTSAISKRTTDFYVYYIYHTTIYIYKPAKIIRYATKTKDLPLYLPPKTITKK